MIGLDTNVLARYYIEDAADAQAQKQRLAARRLLVSMATFDDRKFARKQHRLAGPPPVQVVR